MRSNRHQGCRRRGEYYAIHLPDGAILIRTIEKGARARGCIRAATQPSHLIKAVEPRFKVAWGPKTRKPVSATKFREAFDAFGSREERVRSM